MTLEQTAADLGAQHIANAIETWDKIDADRLIEMLRSLESFCDANDLKSSDYVDWTSLPSAAIPDDVDTGYPIWAMDQSSRLVAGQCADDLWSLPLAEYREDRAS